MKAGTLFGLCCMTLAAVSGCSTTPVYGTIPECDRLIPPEMRKRTAPADLPTPANHPDGHEIAEPWMVALLGQTAQLDKANDRAAGIDHIYAECLRQHREALERTKRGFFGRLFN